MENATYRKAWKARKGLSFFDCTSRLSIITISGEERLSFLQNLVSNDISPALENKCVEAALLTKKSSVIARFGVYIVDDRLSLLVDANQSHQLFTKLQEYHFAEDVVIEQAQEVLLAIQGEKSFELIASLTHHSTTDIQTFASFSSPTQSIKILRYSLFGEPGFIVLSNDENATRLKTKLLSEFDAIELNHEVLEILRIESGNLKQGVDFDSNNLILELDQDHILISDEKGCYPGQEVVARVMNKGKISRKFVGLIAEKPIPAFSQITFENKLVGTSKSSSWSPALKKYVAFALLNKKFYDSFATFDFVFHNNKQLNCKLVRLPFYISSYFNRRAQDSYSEGMKHYHANNYDLAIACFRKAIEADNSYADAWEALAMATEKTGDIDQAIKLNRVFARQDPTAVMAHSNLSRLYMLKGFKDRAEEEMAKASALEFKLKAIQNRQNKKLQQELEKQQKENSRREFERKMILFKKVLQMDPDDEIANFGMGKLHLESNLPEQAVDYLNRVIRENRHYSAAYELLGKALIKSSNNEQAVEVLTTGISIAEDQGDLMPKKAMETMLAQLV